MEQVIKIEPEESDEETGIPTLEDEKPYKCDYCVGVADRLRKDHTNYSTFSTPIGLGKN